MTFLLWLSIICVVILAEINIMIEYLGDDDD